MTVTDHAEPAARDTDAVSKQRSQAPARGRLSPARRATGWALAVALPLVATGIDLLAVGYLGLAADVVLLFLATVAVALVGGLGPALVAAGLSGLLLNFFFTEPRYTLLIASPNDVVSVVGMVLVGAAVAVIVHRAAKLATQAAQAATEAALAQRAVEADQLRTALLAAVGHDLRTPLTSIRASVDSLRDPALALSDADSAELLLTIQESTDRLGALVENLLDSSRLATGAVRPQLRPVGYEDVVDRALRMMDAPDLVRVEVDDTLPAVSADPGLLERVVANVVDNAVRHGRGAPVVIRGSARVGQVDLRVRDSGPGLGDGDREAIFAPFQRRGDRGAAAGVGLGLSVARGFMASMGGTVTAEDTPGGGLTIVLSLPAAAEAVNSA
ncbi:MAG: DUF4118 domain-containing protein [Pseudonocardiaceae bacterium]|nr:DUF4118 domain-containing protein [Pseudonocardiaceae bacterium]